MAIAGLRLAKKSETESFERLTASTAMFVCGCQGRLGKTQHTHIHRFKKISQMLSIKLNVCFSLQSWEARRHNIGIVQYKQSEMPSVAHGSQPAGVQL